MLEAALEAIHPTTNGISTLPLSFHPNANLYKDNFKSIKELVLQPVSQGEKMQCRIVRRREPGLGIIYELYKEESHLTSTFLLWAYRKRRSKGAYYVIGAKPYDMDNFIVAKVKSNFLGTAFTIYDNGISPNKFKKNNRILPNFKDLEKQPEMKLRQELGAVFYEPNILGFKGPRKMTVLLMGMTPDGKRPEFRPSNDSEGLIESYKQKNSEKLLILKNKAPQWNEETQSYVLNFNGRVTLASVKNFQIVHDFDLDYIVMQFGRISMDTFTMDFQYPLCPLQAFSIALSSFDAKLACE
ncbi:brain tubby protein-like protein [Neoconidiobolus thromboides FSU 785]|nr:brain tubby protein-like protein [Neoconidiobolus thromboides FSU 785]